MNKGTRKFALGTVIIGILGYLAGILTAPKSGSETRSSIRHARDNGVAEAEKQLKKLHKELNSLLGEVTDTGKQTAAKLKSKDGRSAFEGEIVDRATKTHHKTREIISALRDGSADDRDLDKAISEATKAIKAIRNYLKK